MPNGAPMGLIATKNLWEMKCEFFGIQNLSLDCLKGSYFDRSLQKDENFI